MGSVNVPSSGHPCPGCGTPVQGDELACRRCLRRLPRELRLALVLARRRRYRDHATYLDVLREAQRWWAEHREVRH